MVIDPRDHGAVYDGVTDDFAAHRAAFDRARTDKIGRVILPSGVSYNSQELEIDFQGIIEGGHGQNYNYSNGTTLLFPKNVNGFRICRADSSSSGGLGDDAVIANLDVRCTDPTTESGSGFRLDARAKLVNVGGYGFGLDGCTIVSTGGFNANCWSIDGGAFKANRRDGLYVDGADTNAGGASWLNTTRNGRNGLWDSSFLGNGYTFAHSATNGIGYWVKGSDGQAYACLQDHFSTADTLPVTGANWQDYWELAAPATSYPAAAINRKYYANGGRNYYSDGASAKNLFVACYTEPGAPRKDYIRYPSQINGGSMDADTEGGPIFAGVKGLEARTKVGSDIIHSAMGDRNNLALDAFKFNAAEQATTIWRIRYDPTAKVWDFKGTSNNTARSYRLIDNGGSTGLPTGLMDFVTLGIGIGGKRHAFGTAAPTTGTWAHGDIVYNTAGSPGGWIGWYCVTAGTPGTWKGFGAIEA